jgi:signal transduction histidine kinase
MADEEDLRARMRGPEAFELLVEVAHDFRSPLGSILFLAEALRDGHGGPVTESQRSQLGLIYSAAFGLSSIAADVMDLAKQEKNLIGDEPVPFSPAEVFRNVERMVRPIVEEKKLHLRVVVPERWQSKGHPHALSRVLLNLTTNALKFTDEGSVEIGVRVLPQSSTEYYVYDTGRGMTPEQQRALFQPFKRRSSQRKDGYHFSGRGIGLSIARKLVSAMGSELRLDSSDESGTRFSFVLGRSPGTAG